ncbi:MAG TPA: VanW family protein [Bacillus sp. (in: firmicutes)]|uniref:VanW family protein n=1 Tax=Bacillus litorisediminis TaxID=2922713 RepID=UPI001FAB7682|nr:VanW family protein [Bacillus litorisediminis]HWO76717.1 VanW family protein [Bacillus sp. (in: firmicutes)]
MRLSNIHPIFYHTRIGQKRFFRFIRDWNDRGSFARTKCQEKLPFSVKRHQSLLRRKLGNSAPGLQESKITNLKIAQKAIDGILIRPGEVFSFWQLVGKPSRDKGYTEGMLLSRGEVTSGIGGGLCQMANLLYWMALHTPLTITERHHHSFDPFPDSGRVLPFGSGAGVFYNYVDFRFKNETNQIFQINVWLTEKHLKGSIQTDQEWPLSYHIEERNHRFLQKDGKNYRENEIWRKTVDVKTGNIIDTALIIKNFSEVKYEIPGNVLEN